MTADLDPGAPAAPQFLVRPDGSVVGDDGASGALAAALPYTGRLARRLGELVGGGDLRLVEARGLDQLIVGVTWTPAGEGTFRAVVAPLPQRAVPSFTVVGAVDTSAALAHCLDRLSSLGGVEWCSVVTADSRVIAAKGDRDGLPPLEEVGNRMLAILRSLEDQHAAGFLRLRFEHGTVVGASLGRHALVAQMDPAEDDGLVAMIDEIRAILAGHDLASVRTATEPEAAVEQPAAAPEPAPAPAPLVGARFGGVAPPRKERRARRFGR
ncbi:hypothetical protein L2K70_18330 [Nocardioides KLBMP 9356]|uniref:Roadblock/LC7 domain-containing protein n=1 Tax=Nocardioides potassii TaxID=2911371 RepID=A0ABS9HGZ3_9ACTN|nr:hypothetical protein [Nocardioides potassii]MCF6379573.1 hypothetical protein [Nocardioides potassii]